MKNKWVKKSGDLLVKAADASAVADTTRNQLVTILEGNQASLTEDDFKNLKRRKLVQQVVRKSARITKGPQFRPKRVKKYADLTKDMLGNKAEVHLKLKMFRFFMNIERFCLSCADGQRVSLERPGI